MKIHKRSGFQGKVSKKSEFFCAAGRRGISLFCTKSKHLFHKIELFTPFSGFLRCKNRVFVGLQSPKAAHGGRREMFGGCGRRRNAGGAGVRAVAGVPPLFCRGDHRVKSNMVYKM